MLPKLILISIYAMSLGMNLANHGKPKEGNYSFWDSLISFVIVFGLLWWGGFFG